MSETAVTPTNQTAPEPGPAVAPAVPDGFFLDGDAPRLGSAPLLPPAPLGSDAAGAAPVTTAAPRPEPLRFAEQAPPVDPADLPTLPTPSAPTVEPIDSEDESGTEHDAPTEHPMAHLMPAKSKPTEASLRAAEMRAVKKAKAKKIKIGVAIGAVVVSAVVGPPLWSWLSNAVNEVGVSPDEAE